MLSLEFRYFKQLAGGWNASMWTFFFQAERRSPQHPYRPRHTLEGAKMRASVRMTRYLESWGAAKPFANLHHRDSMTNENGKINTAVSVVMVTFPHLVLLFITWECSLLAIWLFIYFKSCVAKHKHIEANYTVIYHYSHFMYSISPPVNIH